MRVALLTQGFPELLRSTITKPEGKWNHEQRCSNPSFRMSRVVLLRGHARKALPMSIHQAMWDATNEEEEPLSVLGAATEARARTNAEWTDAVREASRFHSLRAVGVAAGISHARVAQIVGRRA